MALNGCTAMLVGNATADFDLRFTPSGTAVGDVTVAVNSRVMRDGEWEDREDPMFVRVTVWGDHAEHCAETIEKGARLVCTGDLYVRNWETREGDERQSIEMTADAIGPELRWAEAKVTKASGNGDGGRGRSKGRSRDRDDDDREDRGSRGRSSRGRDERGSRGDRRGSDRGSRSADRDDRGSRGKGRRSVWDDDEGD